MSTLGNIGFSRAPRNRGTPSNWRAPSAAPTNGTLRSTTLTKNATNATRYPPSGVGTGLPSELVNGMSTLELNGDLNYAMSCQAGTTFTNRTHYPTKPDHWHVGQIVNFQHIVPALDPNQKNWNKHRVKTDIGPICPKPRYAVIVKIYKTRMIVLPVYSCDGNGITKKSVEYQATAISIWNPAEDDREHRSKLTRDPLTVAGTSKFTPGSHINLNEPCCVGYAWKLTKHDKLDASSTKRLVAWYNIAQCMADQPLGTQERWFEREVERAKNSKTTGAEGWKEAPAPPPLAGSYVSRATGASRWSAN
ncbi:hypothetical protein LTR05_001841 [Lithohypha guttulata]|uniref:DUF6590 domain-containing protein n=1 Tax=Lithohypha guttulata TaxID=1690604 RepID=A0AAN7T9X5_9EURO|nr:hypothetical protein LTR05_001841 [Lithohypha guttulata]